MVAAPTPPARPAADVVSIYSDAYSNISVNEWGPDWGPYSARINDFPIQSNPTKVMNLESGKVFAGIDFLPAFFNATAFTTFHLDYWIAGPLSPGQVLSIKLSNHVGGAAAETSAIEYVPSTILTDQWVSLDIPFSSFTAASAPPNLSRNAISQIVLTAARADASVPVKFYLDNIYLHKNTVLSMSSFDASKIKLFPNPASTSLTIEANDSIESITIYNVLGQEVVSKNPLSNSTTIDVSNLVNGIYFVNSTIDGKSSTTKFIKN